MTGEAITFFSTGTTELFGAKGVMWFFEINSVRNILCSISLFVIFILLSRIWRRYIQKHENFLRSKSNLLYSVLSTFTEIHFCFFIFFAFFLSLLCLNFSISITKKIQTIIGIFTLLFVIKFFLKHSSFVVESLLKTNPSAKNNVNTVIKIIIRIVGILIFFSNIGIDLSPLLAWLGVAWIAIAFALQNILSDLFSSFSILLSKPFVVGDFIQIGEKSTEKIWTVKEISLKTTKLISVQGQEIVIPNSNILNTEILNYGKMTHRRQRISFGIKYGTSSQQLEQIPEIIKEVIGNTKGVTFERCYLEKITEKGYNFLMSYDIVNPEYENSLQINQTIYLTIIKRLEKENIKFALPSHWIIEEEKNQ